MVPFAASTTASTASGKASPISAGSTATLDTLDFLELEIVYTTVAARYYEKLNPRTLVDGARNGIAAYLGEVGIDDARLPFTPVRVSAGDGEDLVDTLVLKQLARYGKRLDGHRLVQATVAGELAALRDPYSLLFRPQAFKKFNAFLGNETFGGIGAVLSVEDTSKRVIVDRVLPGSPAERAGLLRGDEIVAIDGRDARGLGGAGLRDALRGKVGASVLVVYARIGGPPLAGTPVTEAPVGADTPAADLRRVASLKIVRGEVRDPEVRTARFGDTGYLALSRFGDRAGAELTSALHDFKADGVRAIVLDLRANGGGYGDEATAVASAFVTGPVFATRERGGAGTIVTASGNPVWTGPLAVLIDGDTASAAEIVAGAIQDDRAGTLVGTRTFGKGVVQSIFPLPDGSAVKLTTARYTTPKGRDIDKVGITPDVPIAEPAGSTIGDPTTDPQLARAIEVVRRSSAPSTESSRFRNPAETMGIAYNTGAEDMDAKRIHLRDLYR